MLEGTSENGAGPESGPMVAVVDRCGSGAMPHAGVAADAGDRDFLLATISAVVCNYNGGEQVYRAVRALATQDFPLEEIILVDNHSTDGSVERICAAFPQVVIVQMGDNLGLPAARNAGLGRVRGDLVLMVDADVYVTEDCIARLRAAYFETGATLVCPRILLCPEAHIVQCDGATPHYVGTMTLRHAYAPVERLPVEASEVDGCIGACLLLDRVAMLEAGGFDPVQFLYFEDLEFSLRLRVLGHRIVCEPRAVVHHERGIGTAGLSFRGAGPYPRRRAYLTMRNRLLLILTFYRLRTIAVILPVLLIYEMATLIMVLARGWAREWLSAWAWTLRHRRTIVERRRRIQRMRRRADRDVLRGGPVPLAPGLLRSRLAVGAVAVLSHVVEWYWPLARRLAG